MRSIQTSFAFPLASVKPLENLEQYRQFCLTETKHCLADSKTLIRQQCPVCNDQLNPVGLVEGLEYSVCGECKSLYLNRVALNDWRQLLEKVNAYKNSSNAFHASISTSRNENVYQPKLEWIQHTLRLHGLSRSRLLEVATPPSCFSPFLLGSNDFVSVETMSDVEVQSNDGATGVDAVVMLECLDRSPDPAALLSGVYRRVKRGGLVFVTALVCSGFDIAVLGLNNLYLYPPDRTNCFSLEGLVSILKNAGFVPVEISTPGVLDVQIVRSHLKHNPALKVSGFEQQILSSDAEKQEGFQTFLQENLMSSFARIVGRVS